jgi:mycofactocin precursor
MTDHPAAERVTGKPSDSSAVDSAAGPDELYDAEVLVEEVSIDGMCGVY